MRNLLIVFVAVIVISNFLEISSAKRIKRDVDARRNRTNIAQDFVLLHAGNTKNIENKVIKPMTKKDNKSLHDAAMAALTTKSSKKYRGNNELNTYEFGSLKNQTVGQPLPYVLGNREHQRAENRNDTQRVFSKLTADDSKSLEHSKDKKGIIPNNSGIGNVMPSFGQQTANIVGAHILIPPPYLMPSHAFNPFSPIEQMMRFANTLFYKVGIDNDNAENDNSPIEFNSLDSPAPHMFFGSPTIALAQIPSSPPGQKEYLLHSKNGNARTISADRKPIDLLDLIENAFNNPNADQTIHDEIEIFCPVHNSKVNAAHKNCQMGKGDAMEVCTCHLAKNGHDGSHKDHK